VLHVSKDEAAVAGIGSTFIRYEALGETGDSYYQVWLVDEFKPIQYTVAFQTIIRQAFEVRTSQLDEEALLARVLRMQNATVSARRR
jgi:hypothetical protein